VTCDQSLIVLVAVFQCLSVAFVQRKREWLGLIEAASERYLQETLYTKMNAASNNTAFLFTSESVGEGHPGKFMLRYYLSHLNFEHVSGFSSKLENM
jgi:hypothetical protein